jgi:hypothetical protein
MPIHDLPAELVSHILRHCPSSDLFSLSLTCRTFTVLTQPLLYENIDFKRQHAKPHHPSPLQLLLKTLLHRPELGKLIKRLCLRGHGLRPMSDLSLADSEALAERGRTINSHTEKPWHKVLRRNEYDDGRGYLQTQAFTALLLSYCEKLESLSVDHHFYDGTPTMSGHGARRTENFDMALAIPQLGVVSLAMVLLSKLDALKAIEVYNYNDGGESYIILPQLIYLFTLPQVQSLTLSVRSGEAVVTGPQFPPQTAASSVTALHLRDSELRPRAIRTFLDQTPKLRSLRLGLRRFAYAFEADNSNFLKCAKLAAHISGTRNDDDTQIYQPRRSQLLEHLAISIQFWGHNISSGGGAFECGRNGDTDRKARLGITGSFGSFRHFTALKTLEVPLPMLLGWHVYRARPLLELLPDSLTELCFGADMSDWGLFKWDVEAVTTLVETFLLTRFGKGLKVLKYMLYEDSIRSNWDRLEELRESCQNSGVLFQVIRANEAGSEGTESEETHHMLFSNVFLEANEIALRDS